MRFRISRLPLAKYFVSILLVRGHHCNNYLALHRIILSLQAWMFLIYLYSYILLSPSVKHRSVFYFVGRSTCYYYPLSFSFLIYTYASGSNTLKNDSMFIGKMRNDEIAELDPVTKQYPFLTCLRNS